MIALSEGLAVNPVLRMLSLTYCGIDAQGAEALFEIMIYSRSALEEVNLSGNLLMNEGIVILLRGVAIAKSLKKILVADNQFNDDEEVTKALEFCMRKNQTLGKYDLKHNNINEAGKWASLKHVDRLDGTYEFHRDYLNSWVAMLASQFFGSDRKWRSTVTIQIYDEYLSSMMSPNIH